MSQTLARPNSKYSTTLSGAVSDTTSTTFNVNAVPSRVPCILLVDPGTSKQEKLKCTAKGVSTITVTRNFDGAHADTHDLGASIVDYDSPEYITQIADVLDANSNSDNTMTPKVKISINDVNGNEVIKTPATASAINEVTITNAAIGNAPSVSATGDDTNIDLNLAAKGTGSVKINGAPISTSADGWIGVTDTWTYASATTITVPSGAASKYDVGYKIKLTQTTVKYFYVVGVADTVLTINGGTDFTLVNAAISANYYSNAQSPVGFPQWINFTSANRTWDSTPPTTVASSVERFTINGRLCYVTGRIVYTNAGTTNTLFQADMPVTSVGTSAKYHTMMTGGMSPNQDDVLISTAGQSQAMLYSTTPQVNVKLTTGNMSAKAVWYDGAYQI